MFLGRTIAKVTFYGKSHLFNHVAEVILSSCLKIQGEPDLYGEQDSKIQQNTFPSMHWILNRTPIYGTSWESQLMVREHLVWK